MTARPITKRADAASMAEIERRLDRLEHHVNILLKTMVEVTKQGDRLEDILVQIAQQSDAMEELLTEGPPQ